MQLLLLGFLGLVLLIFCIVDLWHLKGILKGIRLMTQILEELTLILRNK